MMLLKLPVVLCVVLCRLSPVHGEDVDIDNFLKLRTKSTATLTRALKEIESHWQPGSAVMLLEASRFAATRPNQARILAALERGSGKKFGRHMDAWYKWLWALEYDPHSDYAVFKSRMYSQVDRRFAEYFESTGNATIRLDEIRWGGVKRDGIPPLNHPKMIPASVADNWLDDSNEVFGVELNGEARCYPKRILAWHEMFKDTIGGESFCGVY